MPERSKEEMGMKRAAILDAARELFVHKGYEETTIAEIAQAAGVAVGTVYLYFRNKREVLTGAALDFEEALIEVVGDPALFQLPIEELPRSLIDAVFKVGRVKKECMSLLQVDTLSAEEIEQHNLGNERMAKLLTALFEHAIEQGGLAPFNVEMYARMLMLLGSSCLHQCFAVEKGAREELYRQYMIELLERLMFGPSLREGRSGTAQATEKAAN
jgi:AcrR family transcriptional regulator